MFPPILTSPDADILPIKLISPFTGASNVNVLYFVEPLPNCNEPLPWCKYNSPSVSDDALDVPLLIWNIAAIYYLFCLL